MNRCALANKLEKVEIFEGKAFAKMNVNLSANSYVRGHENLSTFTHGNLYTTIIMKNSNDGKIAQQASQLV